MNPAVLAAILATASATSDLPPENVSGVGRPPVRRGGWSGPAQSAGQAKRLQRAADKRERRALRRLRGTP